MASVVNAMEQQTVTMMTEEEAPEVGPNDIVIHLVNPYKCGLCDLEFLDKKVFKDHMFSHLDQMKQERPSSQIVMSLTLPPETPGGVTVTRDILQLGEDGSIKQVLQPTTNMTLNQVSPLRELEEAGVLKLDPPKPSVAAMPRATNRAGPSSTGSGLTPATGQAGIEGASLAPGVVKIEGEDGEETEVSEIIDNKDGSFSVSFKGPNNEMQHIQILKPDGMKGDMMIELTNAQGKRRNSRGTSTPNKNNECDICGKILSSATNLIRHKMYHRSERPFICEVCNKGFKDISNLKKHTQIHKRVFPCFLCKKSFLLKSLLVEHLKRHEARTTYVKTGHSTKEVTVRTFVEDDGTRVEEMNMASLGNKIFEYKHRIVKADPSEVVIKEEDPDSSLVVNVPDAESAELVSAAENAEGTEKESSLHKSLMAMFTSEEKESGADVSGNMLEEGTTNSTEPINVDDVKLPASVEDFIKVYQCGHCGKRTVQRGNMMRHIIHHLKDKPFACDECPKRFVDKGELVKHKKTHTKPVRCHQCNGAFAHNRQLLKHLESECLGNVENLNYSILDDGQTYKCDICQIEMKRLGNMIKHVNSHTNGDGGKKPGWYHRSAQRARRIQKRLKDSKSTSAPYHYDTRKQVFVCTFCKKMFRQKVNAERHAKSHSSGRFFRQQMFRRPFKCDMCPAAFSRKLFLDKHKHRHDDKGAKEEETADYGISEDHSGYYCKHCDQKLPQKYRMMSHVQRHISDRTFECTICNKCFSGHFLLNRHKKSHVSQVACDICGTGFTKQFFLDIHRRKMHPGPEETYRLFDESQEEPIDEKDFFACSICGAPFSRLVIMNNHEKKCREESKVMGRLPHGKGFQCKICHKVATLKHNLMVHIRKHEDVVKIDSSGRLFIISDKFGETVTTPSEGSMTPFGKFTRRPRSSLSSSKKSMKVRVKSDPKDSDSEAESMEPEYADEEDFVEEAGEAHEEDELSKDTRVKKTPGGWACTVCRNKFSDKSAMLEHLEDHPNEASEESKEAEKEEEKREKSEAGEEKGEETPMEVDSAPTEPNENGDKESGESAKEGEESDGGKKEVKAGKRTPVARSPRPAKRRKSLTVAVTEAVYKSPLPETPGSARSANRPSRTQKIPSRFLE